MSNDNFGFDKRDVASIRCECHSRRYFIVKLRDGRTVQLAPYAAGVLHPEVHSLHVGDELIIARRGGVTFRRA